MLQWTSWWLCECEKLGVLVFFLMIKWIHFFWTIFWEDPYFIIPAWRCFYKEMWSCDAVKFSNTISINFLKMFKQSFLIFQKKPQQNKQWNPHTHLVAILYYFWDFCTDFLWLPAKAVRWTCSLFKAVSQGGNILQLIKILFVCDAETGSKSDNTTALW